MDVEETVDAIADVVKDTAKDSDSAVVPVVVGLLALGIGIGIGYILGRRNKFEVIKLGDRPITKPPKVIIDADELEETGAKIDSVTVDDQVIEVREVVHQGSVTVNDRPVAERSNIFANADPDDWDLDAEIKKRNPLNPYIIHRDEFFAEDPATENYLQSQLTFYEGDNTLVDEQNKPIYDVSSTIGTIQWGKGSGDPNVCYVRNMSMQTEYEVIRDMGHYRVEVLGLEMEAEQEEKVEKATRVRRMRPE